MLSKALLKRRELMLSLGAAGFLAVPLFRESFVEAQAASFPQRFVVLFVAGGVYVPDGVEGYGTWRFDGVLSPLAGLQADSIQIMGCNNEAGRSMATQSNEPHGAALRGLLTGDSSVWMDGIAKWALTDTIDQQIAAKIGGSTKFQSLQFGVKTTGSQIDQMRLSIKGGSALPPVDSPATMFARLFSDFMPGTAPATPATSTASNPPVSSPGVDSGARGRSILDGLIGEVTALKALAGVNEQQKLDQHLESLRALEQQLPPPPAMGTGTVGGVAVPPPVAGVGCAAPTVGSPDDIPTIASQQLDLLYQALVCDLSRVASLQGLVSAQSGISFPFVGVSPDHHTLEHGYSADIDKVQSHFMGQFANLLNRLKSTPEGAGSMLDNTLVLVCSEFAGAGNHNHDYLPLLTFGKAGGKVTPGRVVTYPEIPHNNALRSIMQPFGINSASIGDAAMNDANVIPLA